MNAKCLSFILSTEIVINEQMVSSSSSSSCYKMKRLIFLCGFVVVQGPFLHVPGLVLPPDFGARSPSRRSLSRRTNPESPPNLLMSTNPPLFEPSIAAAPDK